MKYIISFISILTSIFISIIILGLCHSMIGDMLSMESFNFLMLYEVTADNNSFGVEFFILNMFVFSMICSLLVSAIVFQSQKKSKKNNKSSS